MCWHDYVLKVLLKLNVFKISAYTNNCSSGLVVGGGLHCSVV